MYERVTCKLFHEPGTLSISRDGLSEPTDYAFFFVAALPFRGGGKLLW